MRPLMQLTAPGARVCVVSWQDEIWCGAAHEWASRHRRPSSARVPCAVITVAIVHNDARTQGHAMKKGRGGASVVAGYRLLWKANLTWHRSLMGMRCYGKVCCFGRNCTNSPWWRYTPTPRWALPTQERHVRMVRSCVVTQLTCPASQEGRRRHSFRDSETGSPNETALGLPGCGGLTDLWWDQHKDKYTGGMN